MAGPPSARPVTVAGRKGWSAFLGKVDLLGDRAFAVLNRFVIAVTLPVLKFRTLVATGLFVALPRSAAAPISISRVVGVKLVALPRATAMMVAQPTSVAPQRL